MAKSLRSKQRRKMRGVKREKFAKKELERLKTMIANSKEAESEMKELVVVKTAAQLKKEQKKQDDEEVETMDLSKPKQKVDPKTLKTEGGNYPVWMNQRQVRKKKKEQKKIVKEKARQKKKGF